MNINDALLTVNTIRVYVYNMTTKRACPMCSGSGVIDGPKHADTTPHARRVMARALRKEGYTIRQIMRLCGWKSTRSVMYALDGDDADKR